MILRSCALLFALCLCLPAITFAGKESKKEQKKDGPILSEKEAAQAWTTSPSNVSFAPGEKLTFEVHWTVFHAADLVLSVDKTDAGEWQFFGTTKSRKAIDAMYPVNSLVEARARGWPLDTISYYEKRRESSRRYHRYLYSDFTTNRGFWENYESGDTKWIKFKRGRAMDLFSLCFHIRSQSWKEGQERKFALYSDGKYHKASVRAENAGTREVGKWEALPVIELFSPDIAIAANKNQGSFRAVVTDDARHIPLRIELDMAWGSLKMNLVKAEGILGESLGAKK